MYQTLENTFINVGKHLFQTLDNTFVKRWTILLSDIRKELKILYRLGQPPIYT